MPPNDSGNVQFRFNGDPARVITAMDAIVQKYRNVEDAAQSTANKTRQHAESVSTLGRSMQTTLTDVRNLLIGGGVVGAAMKVTSEFLAWNQHLLEMKRRLGEMAVMSAGAQQSLLGLANQENITIPEAGRRTLATSTLTGAAPDLAKEARRAVHGSLSGDASINKGIQNLIASALARTGGTADQATAFGPLLRRILGQNPDLQDAEKIVAAMEEVMKGTDYDKPGDIAESLAHGGLGGFLEGADWRKVLARQAQAMAVVQNKLQSMRLMQQVDVSMRKDAARQWIEAESGKPYLSMGYDERFEAFQRAVIKRQDDPAAMEELFADFYPAERERVRKYFVAPAAREAYPIAMKVITNASVSELRKRNAEFLASNVAQVNIAQSAEQKRLASLSPYDAAAGQLRTAAETMFNEAGSTEDKSKRLGWWDYFSQLDSTQIESFEYAKQLQRLGITKLWAKPGTGGSAKTLRHQLGAALYEMGISNNPNYGSDIDGIVGEGGMYYSPSSSRSIGTFHRVIRGQPNRMMSADDALPPWVGQRIWDRKPATGDIGATFGTPPPPPASPSQATTAQPVPNIINNYLYGDQYFSDFDRTVLPDDAPRIRK